MTNKEAFKLIGEREKELSKLPDVQKKMLETAKRNGKKAAETLLFGLAVTTLFYGGAK